MPIHNSNSKFQQITPSTQKQLNNDLLSDYVSQSGVRDFDISSARVEEKNQISKLGSQKVSLKSSLGFKDYTPPSGKIESGTLVL